MHSIILTIHNASRTISTGEILLNKVIDGIINNTVGDYEILCMLDGCTDDSEKIVYDYLDKANVRPIILPDVYELRTNNAGFREAKGDYVIVVQDDQIISEHGWNKRMQKPFDNFVDVFAVTARTAHNWIFNPNSFYLRYPDAPKNNYNDLLQSVDEAENRTGLPRNIFAVRSTVNRGPLMINLDDLKKINYLDDEFAPCDMDDHDLMFRAYLNLNKVCGCYWIGMEELERRWSASEQDMNYDSQHKNVKIFYERYGDILNQRRIIENRVLK